MEKSSSPPSQKWMIVTLLVALVILLGLVGFFAYQNFQLVQQQASLLQPPTATPNLPSPSAEIKTAQTSTSSAALQDNSFTFKNFTIGYPDAWTFLDMTVDNNFPLKSKFAPLASTDKAIALEQDGLYLIISMKAESTASSSATFATDQQYQQFIANKDEVTIGNSTFYLSKGHHNIPGLQQSTNSPENWSVLAEYLPNKGSADGKSAKGYDKIITRDGYNFNFIIASTQGGITDRPIQEEIIEILETISW